MRLKVVCNFMGDYDIYRHINDVWNIDGTHNLTHSDDYTHLIVWNNYEPSLIRVPKERVYGIVTEPKWSYFYNPKLPEYCNKVFHHQADKWEYPNVVQHVLMGLHHCWDKRFKGEIMFAEQNTKRLIEQPHPKDRLLSIIINNHHGSFQEDFSDSLYRKREALVEKLLMSDLEFDMFGIDWDTKDPRFKGFVINKKDGLSRYKYTLSLENSSSDGYVTEKFIDAILCNTTPIYNGHPTVFNHYGDKCCEYLHYDGNEIEQIRKIIANKENKTYDLALARNRYFYEFNPLEVVEKYAKL